MDKNQSYWASTITLNNPLILDASIHADIAIVGAGLLGLSAAYHLTQLFPSKKIAVIEAAQVANGASGRNGGQLMAMNTQESFKSAIKFLQKKKPLPESFRTFWEKTLHGIDLYEEIIDRHKIDCGFSREGSMSFSATNYASESMARYAEAANEIGIPLKFVNAQDYKKMINAEGYFGGIYYPKYGQINPARYLKGLADVLREKGIDIYEHTPVTKIEEGKQCKLLTPKGQVSADTLVLATNAYSPQLGYFKNGIAPIINPCSVTEPLSQEILSQIGWHRPRCSFADTQPHLWYLSVTEDYRILIGGGDGTYFYGGKTSYSPNWIAKYRTHFYKKITRLFPQIKDVAIGYVWAGPIDASLDLAPSVGVMGDFQNIFYGLGFTGEGVNQAHLSGKIIADLYADNPEPWQDLFFVNRLPKYTPPDPIRYAALKVAFAFGRTITK